MAPMPRKSTNWERRRREKWGRRAGLMEEQGGEEKEFIEEREVIGPASLGLVGQRQGIGLEGAAHDGGGCGGAGIVVVVQQGNGGGDGVKFFSKINGREMTNKN